LTRVVDCLIIKVGMKNNKKKKEIKIGVPMSKYRYLLRRRDTLLRAKTYARELWRVLSRVK